MYTIGWRELINIYMGNQMTKLNNKFAIGCLVQWYEIEIIEEYIISLKKSLKNIKNNKNIIIDFTFVKNQDLEKINKSEMSMDMIQEKFINIIESFPQDINWRVTDELVTIADYRRWFNDYYCEKVDVLMWGESDSLLPKQTFEILDNLHQAVEKDTPKYLGFFGTCKMWDDSWKQIEHDDFTDKPFIEGDIENWWSLRYTMSKDEMNDINDKTNELEVSVASPHKFNGCGLVISSEVIKAGVNIPESVFFVHEDSAFMQMTNKVLGNIPQYVIKNVLLVHNRKHPDKRKYIKGEEGPEGGRRSHEWYMKANRMCEQNYINLFNPNYKSYTWEDVWK